MKILFIVPYVPNLIRVRPYNLIRHLAQRGHEVSVLTLHGDEREQGDVQQLSASCHDVTSFALSRSRSLLNVLGALPQRMPLQAAYCWQPALGNEITRLFAGENGSAHFDVVHVEHLRGAVYALHVKEMAAVNNRTKVPPVVWDSVDCISLLFQQTAEKSRSQSGRWMARLELGRTRRYEAWLARQFDHVLITSPEDRAALLALRGNGAAAPPISVLGNGVALDYFSPGPEEREPQEIVISGKMSYHANVTMALYLVQEIMPLVWARRPGVRVTIVGKDPPQSVLALAEHPQVTVTGTVPDLRPYLQRATVAAAPVSYAAGVQNKVLEAMACGAPVVATEQATSSLQAVPGRDFLLANSASQFAQQILTLIEDPEKCKAVGKAGRQYVNKYHNWGAVAAQLETIYRQVIERRDEHRGNN
jgi:sugar transferase (PEP-CTERM/EpsH1 system associated)